MTALAITLGTLNPRSWREAALAADALGFDAVFISDHIVFPERMAGALGHGAPSPPPATPLYDSVAYLCFLAGQTRRVKLGTFVYLAGLRHPFIVARAFATLDIISDGRAIAGVGAGWLTSEMDALGIDPRSRGARLDEAITTCRRLWAEPLIENAGGSYPFEPVRFEPKPPRGAIPVHVGGESDAALARAARLGEGWMGMAHTPDSAVGRVTRLADLRARAGRSGGFEITVSGTVADGEDLERWARAGVDRVVVSPWRNSREAIPAMETLARRAGLPGA
ncbi:MAG: TIGR03619 family F420-dependent LLM class oxidoreductase [Gammaproteobacteria bacterium]